MRSSPLRLLQNRLHTEIIFRERGLLVGSPAYVSHHTLRQSTVAATAPRAGHLASRRMMPLEKRRLAYTVSVGMPKSAKMCEMNGTISLLAISLLMLVAVLTFAILTGFAPYGSPAEVIKTLDLLRVQQRQLFSCGEAPCA